MFYFIGGMLRSNWLFYLGGMTHISNFSIGYPIIRSDWKNLVMVSGRRDMVKLTCSWVFPGVTAITKVSWLTVLLFRNYFLASFMSTSVLNNSVDTLLQSW